MWVGRNRKWDLAADVVVVGFGGAGGAAAISAHDVGAQVLILEKQAADGHLTSTAMSGGIIMCPSDIGAAARYMRELCRVNGSVAWTDDGVI
ncbi:MAG: FAD-binding protein, partial [Dehalococcoidia bacterium]|nr:FAD-binding protein [Dehalococcoidia bacterium]